MKQIRFFPFISVISSFFFQFSVCLLILLMLLSFRKFFLNQIYILDLCYKELN